MLNTHNVVDKILYKGKYKSDKWSKNEEMGRCWNCGKTTPKSDLHYWYAFDQDNLVCTNCAKKLKHLETAYRGMNVYETSTWGKK